MDDEGAVCASHGRGGGQLAGAGRATEFRGGRQRAGLRLVHAAAARGPERAGARHLARRVLEFDLRGAAAPPVTPVKAEEEKKPDEPKPAEEKKPEEKK